MSVFASMRAMRRVSASRKLLLRGGVRALSSAPASDTLFDKVLIANRGEIACRVMQTCKEMGIKTVAIYSVPDAESKHVAMADEAVCVGPAASNQSYLNMDNIMHAIEITGAQAVHPGYGFLSENAQFSDRLAEAGVVFLGPGKVAIEAMGDKIMSKKIAKEAGVNTVPGYEGEVHNVEEALKVCADVGFPVMIKASAGGGGKGMRIAVDMDDVTRNFELARNEAMNSFGDDRILIERFIVDPRHIEIQVLADKQGNCIYLNERECSIQRRNQKVLEEAPSVFLTHETRAAMGEQAVALSKAVGYESAGTVEFLVDPQQNFYFLEMNTRLQVEHPVTELITGVDLVEQMIRVGAGQPLSITQDDIPLVGNGWAVEARVYAENPYRKFLPSIGRVSRYLEPPNDGPPGVTVRCDSGIVEGSDISVHYDPMICKLIVHAPDRDTACAELRRALDAYVIRGPIHNIPFLSSLLAHPRFLGGDISTAFIEEEYPEGFTGHKLTDGEEGDMFTMLAALHMREEARALAPEAKRPSELQLSVAVKATDGGIVEAPAERLLSVTEYVPDRTYGVRHGAEGEEALCTLAAQTGEDFHSAFTTGAVQAADGTEGESNTLQVHGKPYSGAGGGSWSVQYRGASYTKVLVRSSEAAALESHMPVPVVLDTSNYIVSPMPGQLISVAVSVGDEVEEGDEVAVVEAMKMQNVMYAPRDGVVKTIHAEPGSSLSADQFIVEFESSASEE